MSGAPIIVQLLTEVDIGQDDGQHVVEVVHDGPRYWPTTSIFCDCRDWASRRLAFRRVCEGDDGTHDGPVPAWG